MYQDDRYLIRVYGRLSGLGAPRSLPFHIPNWLLMRFRALGFNFFDPAQGGVLTRLRDGGIGDPTNAAYVANTTGAAGYSSHLQALAAQLDTTQSFDPTSGGAVQAPLEGSSPPTSRGATGTRPSCADRRPGPMSPPPASGNAEDWGGG